VVEKSTVSHEAFVTAASSRPIYRLSTANPFTGVVNICIVFIVSHVAQVSCTRFFSVCHQY